MTSWRSSLALAIVSVLAYVSRGQGPDNPGKTRISWLNDRNFDSLVTDRDVWLVMAMTPFCRPCG